MQNDGGDDDNNLNFFEPISYSKLIKYYSLLHPVDPETKETFEFKDRTTVKDYNTKLSDACNCYAMKQKIMELFRYIRKLLK